MKTITHTLTGRDNDIEIKPPIWKIETGSQPTQVADLKPLSKPLSSSVIQWVTFEHSLFIFRGPYFGDLWPRCPFYGLPLFSISFPEEVGLGTQNSLQDRTVVGFKRQQPWEVNIILSSFHTSQKC